MLQPIQGTGNTAWSISPQLMSLGHKMAAYNFVKYNYWVHPQKFEARINLLCLNAAVSFCHRQPLVFMPQLTISLLLQE